MLPGFQRRYLHKFKIIAKKYLKTVLCSCELKINCSVLGLNPNSIGVEIGHVSVLTSLSVKSFFFELKLYVFFMTKAVSNQDIRFSKAVLCLREHGHFSLNFASHCLPCPPQ